MPIDLKNPGGTPGGARTFVLGLIMAVAGGFLLMQQVQVHGGYWYFGWAGTYGRSFGLTLLPLLFGIGLLFFDGRSVAGRILTVGGGLLILLGIIMNLDIHFQQTSLYNLLVMLALLVGGIGLIGRAVMPMTKAPDTTDPKAN